MEVYASHPYSRLKMDKYIESNRAIDKITKKLCNNEQSIAYIGGAEFSPNSPIGIKKHVRCPGTRKLARSFRKFGTFVHYVDEYNTSQHCGRCGQRFDRRLAKNARFKVCQGDCVPHPALMVPNMIVSLLPNRVLMEERRTAIEMMREIGAPVDPINLGRLVSKVAIYRKRWHANVADNLDSQGAAVNCDENAECRPQKTAWHRDIAAARLIWYKGNNAFDLKMFFP